MFFSLRISFLKYDTGTYIMFDQKLMFSKLPEKVYFINIMKLLAKYLITSEFQYLGGR